MKLILISIISLVLFHCAIPMQNEPATISEKEIYDHIAYLASDELEGRKPGTPTGDQAADYIANHFNQLGLTLLGESGNQYFEVVTSVALGPNNSLNAPGIDGVAGENFTPTAFSSSVSLEAPVSFVGYGFTIESDTLNWDDYDAVNVKDRWVMILRGTPENEARSSKFDKYSSLRHKLLVARDHGAAGVIYVSGSKFEAEDELMDLRIERNLSQATLPVLHIKRELADQLLTESSKTVSGLETTLDTDLKPASLELDIVLSVTTEIIQQEVTTQNVIALLPGSDAVLKDEYIVVGAHYDHLGWGGKGSGSRKPDTSAVHNGADDNASGVAAVLEIAEKLALGKHAPKRSVLFMAFGAEEMGLLGSKFFTKNPLVDKSQIKQMFNLDMVGRLNPTKPSLTVGGTGTGLGMEDFLLDHAIDRDFQLSTTPDGYGPSDHAAFYVEDVPVLFFFTGITEEYHTPQDDVETINISGEKAIADYAYDLIADLGSRKETFTFQEAGPKGPPKGGKRGKVKMGIIPDFAAAKTNGFLLGGVVPGGPAAIAGMESGDVMIALEGLSVMNVYDYMSRMAEVKPGDRVTVEVMRGDEKLILIVEL
ncbi:MAG: M20/M25/M40 family metallo-hydrolase [Candidatus Marinimicrobia bacterium]|nr:M20/M25/M40 family metallo-hydrolase [Candidatus Neomarinimicrobiota bacterium]